MQVIGGALLASLGTYAFVVAQIQRTHAPFAGFAPGVPHDPLRLVFAALALVGFVLYFPRREAWEARAREMTRDDAARGIRPPGT